MGGIVSGAETGCWGAVVRAGCRHVRSTDPHRRSVTLRGSPAGRRRRQLRAVPGPREPAVDDRAHPLHPRDGVHAGWPRRCRQGGPTGARGASRSRSTAGTPAPWSSATRGTGRAEVAFGAHPSVRGTGAMERAVRLLLAWGFSEQGVAGRRLACRRRQLGLPQAGLAPRLLLRRHRPSLPPHARGAARRLGRHPPRHRRPRPAPAWLEVPVLEVDGLRLRPWREATSHASWRPAATSGPSSGWAGCRARTARPTRGPGSSTSRRTGPGAGVNWAVVDVGRRPGAGVDRRIRPGARDRGRDRLLGPPRRPRGRGDDPRHGARGAITRSTTWECGG